MAQEKEKTFRKGYELLREHNLQYPDHVHQGLIEMTMF